MAVYVPFHMQALKVLFCTLLYYMNHPLCDIEFLVGGIQVHYDEHIGFWTYLPHNTVLMAQQHQPLNPLLLPYFFPLSLDKGGGLYHMGGC